MSEPTYPRLFMQWSESDGYNDSTPCTTKEISDEYCYDGAVSVELIPRPEVDRLIAEAVAAERERAREVVERHLRNADHETFALLAQIASEIGRLQS